MLCTPGNLDGRRWDTVGITGPSHAVIHNLLGQVIARADKLDVARPRIGQRAGQDTSYLHPGAAGLEHGALETGLRDGDLDVEAGTAWVWAREQFQGSVDTLFVDEAGQMSLANVLAARPHCSYEGAWAVLFPPTDLVQALRPFADVPGQAEL